MIGAKNQHYGSKFSKFHPSLVNVYRYSAFDTLLWGQIINSCGDETGKFRFLPPQSHHCGGAAPLAPTEIRQCLRTTIVGVLPTHPRRKKIWGRSHKKNQLFMQLFHVWLRINDILHRKILNTSTIILIE